MKHSPQMGVYGFSNPSTTPKNERKRVVPMIIIGVTGFSTPIFVFICAA